MLPEYITKIEGHGVLNIHFKECKARLEVSEGERLFEAVLLGQDAGQAPFITSRICGVCPTAHNLASIKAIENGLNIQVDDTTKSLRELMLSGQIIFSHLLHLFFLVLPDYYQVPSALDIAQKFPAEYHLALNLKRFSDKLLISIGGRHIHPTLTAIGGFTKYPTKGDLVTLREDIDQVLDEAKDFATIFTERISFINIERETKYLALDNGNYDLYEGEVKSSDNMMFPPTEYKSHIRELVKDYSTAKFGELTDDGDFMVGALPRLALHGRNKLNPKAKAVYDQFIQGDLTTKKHNPFNNIPAQAIELLHFIEESAKIIDRLLDSKYITVPIKPLPKLSQPTWGIGAVEAPRGTLYHAYEIDQNGKIINADIVTPTVQNLTSLEKDAEALLRYLKLDHGSQKVCVSQLEMLIRAYDPCITCSVH